MPARNLRHQKHLLWFLLAVFLLYGLPTGHMHVFCFSEERQIKIHLDVSQLHDHCCFGCHEHESSALLHQAKNEQTLPGCCHECRCHHIPFQSTDPVQEPAIISSFLTVNGCPLNLQVACGSIPTPDDQMLEQPFNPLPDTASMRYQWCTISLLI